MLSDVISQKNKDSGFISANNKTMPKSDNTCNESNERFRTLVKLSKTVFHKKCCYWLFIACGRARKSKTLCDIKNM